MEFFLILLLSRVVIFIKIDVFVIRGLVIFRFLFIGLYFKVIYILISMGFSRFIWGDRKRMILVYINLF